MNPPESGAAYAERLVHEMTLAEKLGQMTQVSNRSVTLADIVDYRIGSVLSGGGENPDPNNPGAWRDMVGSFVDASRDTPLRIPILYGVDAVHGHSNVAGATIFPHNIGLGAAADEDLVRRIGSATAAEMMATGVRWTFAPALAVPQDIRWGRTYEGYGRDAALVSKLGAALVSGLQGTDAPLSVLTCAKHFVGDGATTWGSTTRPEWVHWWDGWGDEWQIDQGDARITEAELRSTHLQPYRAAIAAGAMTVMASYSSWNGVKLHAHHYLLTDVLKRELRFRGFVVSDWMGVDQIGSDYDVAVVTAINAGVDMVMVPNDYRRFLDTMARAIGSGLISMARVDDAVRRILRAKHAVGLTNPALEAPPLNVVGSKPHRTLAAEAVRRSAVLLKNARALPLSPATRSIEVAGPGADNIGLQCGGWTVGWQGGRGAITKGSTLLDGLRATAPCPVDFDPAGDFPDREHSDIGIVCIAESPYAEGEGDRAVPGPDDEDRALIHKMRARCDRLIVVIYCGRPLVLDDLADQADALVVAWLPGTEADAIGELLTGGHPFSAATPQPWPRSAHDLGSPDAMPEYPEGHGLRTPGAQAMP